MNMFSDYYDISFFFVFNSIIYSFVRFLFLFHTFITLSLIFPFLLLLRSALNMKFIFKTIYSNMWLNVHTTNFVCALSRHRYVELTATVSQRVNYELRVYYGLRGTNAFHATQINKFNEIHSPVLKDASFDYDIPCGLSLLFDERWSEPSCERDWRRERERGRRHTLAAILMAMLNDSSMYLK